MSTQFRKKLANLKLGELVGMPLRAFFISSFRYVILYILYMLYMLYTGQTRLQRPRYSVSSQTASFPPLRGLGCCTWPLLAQVEGWGGSASPPSFRLVVLRDTAPWWGVSTMHAACYFFTWIWKYCSHFFCKCRSCSRRKITKFTQW